ncbi:GNAT family N-acetyltransferase [Cohnella thermotolerans]|uniref:GNAT family N-acetyltransferase n=1 Tax=Cohnella thermotolerans TaxID=329858 RepID=UPI0003F966EB|nr:GNAT family N-acetyltransferase [Cohnella thermotolerans]
MALEKPKAAVVAADAARLDELTELALALWPEKAPGAMKKAAAEWLASDKWKGFLAVQDGRCVGFALLSIRTDYVEGSDGDGPVGYVEGVYVSPECRRQGISRALLDAGERWARVKGCKQMGSDLYVGNEDSYAFHLGVGCREAGRIVCMIKDLEPED